MFDYVIILYFIICLLLLLLLSVIDFCRKQRTINYPNAGIGNNETECDYVCVIQNNDTIYTEICFDLHLLFLMMLFHHQQGKQKQQQSAILHRSAITENIYNF